MKSFLAAALTDDWIKSSRRFSGQEDERKHHRFDSHESRGRRQMSRMHCSYFWHATPAPVCHFQTRHWIESTFAHRLATRGKRMYGSESVLHVIMLQVITTSFKSSSACAFTFNQSIDQSFDEPTTPTNTLANTGKIQTPETLCCSFRPSALSSAMHSRVNIAIGLSIPWCCLARL